MGKAQYSLSVPSRVVSLYYSCSSSSTSRILDLGPVTDSQTDRSPAESSSKAKGHKKQGRARGGPGPPQLQGESMRIISLAMLQHSVSVGLNTPAWDWEPKPSNTIQHCLNVPRTNGSWPHQVARYFNRSEHWVQINESVTWVNNSRLLSLAVPEGTPPPGGWPVIMDLLVKDYPVRGLGRTGINPGKQTCGLDGNAVPKSVQDPAAAEVRKRCKALVLTRCGREVLHQYDACTRCSWLNATNRNSFVKDGCTPQILEQLTIMDTGTDGYFCGPMPPVTKRCNQSIEAECGWTKDLLKRAQTEHEPWWKYYVYNCSTCVANFTRTQRYANQTQNKNWGNETGCTDANDKDLPYYPIYKGFCQPTNYPGYNRAAQFHHTRWFNPFSSPARLVSQCSCINGSAFQCYGERSLHCLPRDRHSLQRGTYWLALKCLPPAIFFPLSLSTWVVVQRRWMTDTSATSMCQAEGIATPMCSWAPFGTSASSSSSSTMVRPTPL
eukprot:COSAG05_NODE_3879_length_1793_cov_1.595041_1_plen_494_part_10